MLSDPVRIADAINNAKFVAGDEVVLSQGPHKYKQGIYLGLKDDVEWAAIEESNGTVSSHPVEWMSSYREPLSYYSLTGRSRRRRKSPTVCSLSQGWRG